ncbi:uncharacterized protein METZ01_LOCUS8637, partial [marine metagenome]
RMVSSILDRGSRYFMENLTEGEEKGCWLKLSEN